MVSLSVAVEKAQSSLEEERTWEVEQVSQVFLGEAPAVGQDQLRLQSYLADLQLNSDARMSSAGPVRPGGLTHSLMSNSKWLLHEATSFEEQ